MIIDYLNNAIIALKNLHKNGVSERLENEFSTVRVEDWIEELERVYNYEPDASESPAEFERNGGYGLSAKERNE